MLHGSLYFHISLCHKMGLTSEIIITLKLKIEMFNLTAKSWFHHHYYKIFIQGLKKKSIEEICKGMNNIKVWNYTPCSVTLITNINCPISLTILWIILSNLIWVFISPSWWLLHIEWSVNHCLGANVLPDKPCYFCKVTGLHFKQYFWLKSSS